MGFWEVSGEFGPDGKWWSNSSREALAESAAAMLSESNAFVCALPFFM